MPDIRPKDLPDTSAPSDGDELILDSFTGGTRRTSFLELKTQIASDFLAAPTDYKQCPLNTLNKIPTTYLSTSESNPKGAWDATNNSPGLANGGSNVAGDYYDVTVAGTQTFGGTAYTFVVGDVIKYNGTVWYQISSVANFYDGTSTQAGAATTGDYFQTADVNDRALSKSPSNGLDLDGINDDISFGDSALFEARDGTIPIDAPYSWAGLGLFKVSGSSEPLWTKDTASAPNREYFIEKTSSDKLRVLLMTDASNYIKGETDIAIPLDEWLFIAVTYDGSETHAGIKIYINGVAVAITTSLTGTYTGMPGSTAPMKIGEAGSAHADVKVKSFFAFNRELTAADALRLSIEGTVPVADQWGGASGGSYTADFTSDSLDSWSISGADGAIDATTTVGAEADNIRFLCDTTNSSNHFIKHNSFFTVGKRYRLSGWQVYIPAAQSNIDGLRFTQNTSTLFSENTPTLGSWITLDSFEFVATQTSLRIYALDGGSSSFQDAGGDDLFSVRAGKITAIGAVLSLNPDNIESDGDWIDASSNELNGTNTGATPLMVKPQTSGTFTPVLKFGATAQTAGVAAGFWWKRENDIVEFTIRVELSANSLTGNVTVSGMPFPSLNDATKRFTAVVWSNNMTGLTGQVTALVINNDTTIGLYAFAATGNIPLTEAQCTTSTIITITGAYEIA